MSYSSAHILSSVELAERELEEGEWTLKKKIELATLETKTNASTRKSLAVTPSITPSREGVSPSEAAAILDDGLNSDGAKRYTKLSEEALVKEADAKESLEIIEKCTRLNKVQALLISKINNCENTANPETSFSLVLEETVKVKGEVSANDYIYYIASVRVGGKYALAMCRRLTSNLGSEYNIDELTLSDKLFPIESRDSFILDDVNPLVRVEDHNSTTYAHFFSGLDLSVCPADRFSKYDENSGSAVLYSTRHVISVTPLRFLFDVVATTDMHNEFDIHMPVTQPMDIDDVVRYDTMIDAEVDRRERLKREDVITQRIDVFEFGAGDHTRSLSEGKKLFSLLADEISSYNNSWCNRGGDHINEKTGGFSGIEGQKDMNDTRSYADCIDVRVSPTGECTVTIESGRRLFEAKQHPYIVNTRRLSETNTNPGIIKSGASSLTNGGSDEDDDSVQGGVDVVTMDTKKRRIQKPSKLVLYKMTNPNEENAVMSKLSQLAEKRLRGSAFGNTDHDDTPWWRNKKNLPLKINELPSMIKVASEHSTEDIELSEDIGLKAAVRSPIMLTNLSSESEVNQIIKNAMSNLFEVGATTGHKKVCNKICMSLLEKGKKYIRNAQTLSGGIMDDESVKVAEGLLIDEAAAASVAQIITQDIVKSGIFGGIASNVGSEKLMGMRKRITGRQHINYSHLKNDDEREMEVALKEWVKTHLQVIENNNNLPPSIYQTNVLGDKRKAAVSSTDEPPSKNMKSVDGSATPTTVNEISEGTTQEFITIVPPSFVKTVRLNISEQAETVSDIMGRNLYGMKDATNVFERMCNVVKTLKSELIHSPSQWFSISNSEEDLLYGDLLRTREIIEESTREKKSISVLLYESNRLAPLFEIGKTAKCNKPALYNVYESTRSWVLSKEEEADDEDVWLTPGRIMASAAAVRRIQEEQYAYKNLVCLLMFNMLCKDLEGGEHPYNTTLSSSFTNYCTLVIRNRLCDMYGSLNGPSGNANTAAELIGEMVDEISHNNMVMSVLLVKIVDALKWICDTDIPSGFLKGYFDDQHDKNKFLPSQTLDETSKYVIPDMKIGTNICHRTTRIASNVNGPYFIPADFTKLGLPSVKNVMLLINTTSRKGMFTACPPYDQPEDKKGILKNISRNLNNNPSLYSNRSCGLPSFLLSLSHVAGAPRNPSGFFNKKTFQHNISRVTDTKFSGLCKKPFVQDQYEKTKDAWRAGFEVPRKVYEEILNNSGRGVVHASIGKKSKMSPSMNDEVFCFSSFKSVEKTVRLIHLFTNQDSNKAAQNLEADTPTEIELRMLIAEEGGDLKELVSLNTIQDNSGRNDYDELFSLVFNRYKTKSFKIEDSSTKKITTNPEVIDDMDDAPPTTIMGSEPVTKRKTSIVNNRSKLDIALLCSVVNTFNRHIQFFRKTGVKMNTHASSFTRRIRRK
uniref:Uncharacterized protein n=1 Tax=Chionoecetes opilio bacilliform virus TaxID=1825681 RepID=A0A1Q3DL03_9VIRU|nr:wsv151-like protein [Chionoecetes opilio bacilliform virus]GAV93154.1 hypothetical protein SCV_030 [Chionoecetes opilio bacilliform virus]